ncbi:recombinase family protein [Enterococcus rivorum]|uniref:recombinase family protein n=1 Tax=Enterococcus rivorum TaxID=762845 RepID=UPI00363D8519
MQFYAYDRTSSWDTHKVSNEAQWLKIKTYVQKISGATVMRFSDYGRSGGTIEREGFQALREAITASSEERVLLVWRYDRIARNVAVAIEFMSLCEQHHVHIVSLSEPLPQGAGTGIAAQKCLSSYYSFMGKCSEPASLKIFVQDYFISKNKAYIYHQESLLVTN